MLLLLSYLYGKIIDLRNAAYDRGIFETHDLHARTISVGNLTTGGTGKSPVVALIADLLLARGEKVCILTRGYGRSTTRRVLVADGVDICETDPAKTGDEPLELATKLSARAIVIANADRLAAAEWARRRFRGVTTFILDDGFQHRKAGRDVDIVCVDATQPLAAAKILPAGRLRERTSNLSRANMILVTRTELVATQALTDLRTDLAKLAPEAAVFECRTVFAASAPLGGPGGEDLEKGKAVFAFCGLGNPESFFAMLRAEGFNLAGTHAYDDHHAYSQADILTIAGKAHAVQADALITTQKDAVKLDDLEVVMPCYIAQADIVIDRPDEFAALI